MLDGDAVAAKRREAEHLEPLMHWSADEARKRLVYEG